jgi:hypothetical protein
MSDKQHRMLLVHLSVIVGLLVVLLVLQASTLLGGLRSAGD